MTAHLLLTILILLSQTTTSANGGIQSPDNFDLLLFDSGNFPDDINYVYKDSRITLAFDNQNSGRPSGVSTILPKASGDYYLLKIKSVDDLYSLSGKIPYVTIGDMAIFRTDAEGAADLSNFGWGLTRLNPSIFVENISLPWGPPRITVADSSISRLVSIITPQTSRQLIADLSGIYSRYSYVQGCRQAEQYVFDRFSELGLETSFFTFQYNSTTMRDVIGQIRGQAFPESVIIVCGHLDCTSENRNNYAPGAEDNASGSAVVIDAARALSRYSTGLTVRFVAFTGEEQGLIGSDYYASYVQSQGQLIAAVINVDMVGYSGPYALDMHIFSDPQSFWLGQLAARAVADYSSLDSITHYEQSPRWGSDHYSFSTRGYPSIFFIDAWDGFDWYPYYHTTSDTLGNINLVQQSSIGQVVAALTAALAHPDFGPIFLPGDANSSGDVNGLDVVFMVNYFKGGLAPDPILRADTNGDCSANGLDVVYLVNYLKGGPEPHAGQCR